MIPLQPLSHLGDTIVLIGAVVVSLGVVYKQVIRPIGAFIIALRQATATLVSVNQRLEVMDRRAEDNTRRIEERIGSLEARIHTVERIIYVLGEDDRRIAKVIMASAAARLPGALDFDHEPSSDSEAP